MAGRILKFGNVKLFYFLLYMIQAAAERKHQKKATNREKSPYSTFVLKTVLCFFFNLSVKERV